MIALLGVGGLAGASLASPLRRRFRPTVLTRGVFYFEAAVLPLLALTHDPYALGAIAAVASLGGVAWNSVIVSARLRTTPDALHGRVASATRLLTSILVPFGVLGAGVLIEATDTTVAILAMAGSATVLAAVVAVSPSIRAGLPAIPVGSGTA